MSDNRKMEIFEAIIEQYIKTGEPIGSKALIEAIGLTVSSATIRNEMAALERMGLLEQPHTSAGRVPTIAGFHAYIEQMLSSGKPAKSAKERIDSLIESTNDIGELVLQSADELADITGCATVSITNIPKFSVITRVEVIPAGHRVYAILMIASNGNVKNRVCRLEFDLTETQMEFFETFVRENLCGIKMDQLTSEKMRSLAVALGTYMMALSPLLYAVYELSNDFYRQDTQVWGQANLLNYSDFDPKELVQFMANQQGVVDLMTQTFSGIKVVFGRENGSLIISNSTLIAAGFGDDQAYGKIGVIGPMRLDYSKVINCIEYLSKQLETKFKQLKDGSETTNAR